MQPVFDDSCLEICNVQYSVYHKIIDFYATGIKTMNTYCIMWNLYLMPVAWKSVIFNTLFIAKYQFFKQLASKQRTHIASYGTCICLDVCYFQYIVYHKIIDVQATGIKTMTKYCSIWNLYLMLVE